MTDKSFVIDIRDFTVYGNGYAVILNSDEKDEVCFENLQTTDQIKIKLQKISEICFTRFMQEEKKNGDTKK